MISQAQNYPLFLPPLSILICHWLDIKRMYNRYGMLTLWKRALGSYGLTNHSNKEREPMTKGTDFCTSNKNLCFVWTQRFMCILLLQIFFKLLPIACFKVYPWTRTLNLILQSIEFIDGNKRGSNKHQNKMVNSKAV